MQTTETHVDDWLDTPPVDESERLAKEWLERFRSTYAPNQTIEQMVEFDRQKNAWLRARKLFCTYKGEIYLVTGASRIGDVWLSRDFEREHGYDKRVDVTGCSGWRIERSTPQSP